MSTLLVINFFPAFNPPLSGGEIRLNGLYRELSKTNNVTMITSTDFGARYEEIRHSSSFVEMRFPKDEIWRNAYSTLERSGVSGELSGLAFAIAVSDPDCALRHTAREHAANADFIVHEFPFSEPIFSDGIYGPEVYNSHNFELSLLPSIARGPGLHKSLLKLMRLEHSLASRAVRIFATSNEDLLKFELFYGVPRERLAICRNGFDAGEADEIASLRLSALSFESTRSAVFLGSEHRPNVEAAESIAHLASQVPNCQFFIAGAVCKQLNEAQFPSNVRFLGVLAPSQKRQLLSSATVFINPVVLGSGTSLKAVEALASGIPMVSTPAGVRGIDVVHGRDALIVERAQFSDAVRECLRDGAMARALARNGRKSILDSFTWTAISRSFERSLKEHVAESEPAALTLAINDYDIGAGESGGGARILNTLNSLSGDKLLLSFGTYFSVDLIGGRSIKITVPKTEAHSAFERTINEGERNSANDIVAALFCSANYLLRRIIGFFVDRTSVVIFEHCYMAPLLDTIARARPSLPVVYSAHNVETELKQRVLSLHRAVQEIGDFVRDLEESLARRAAFVVCCTETDAEHFRSLNAHTIVCANGCELPLERVEPLEFGVTETICGFLGSGHGPNVDAVDFILKQLVPFFPDVKFEFVGGVCEAVRPPKRSNVHMYGRVSAREKNRIMSRWAIGLNPADEGGGSSLKLPDYLSHGAAALTTSVGARGFAVAENKAGIVTDVRNYRHALREMLGPQFQLNEARKNALRYAERELSWAKTCEAYGREVARVQCGPKWPELRSLLVVTYRYTEPAKGGAEEFLLEFLKEIQNDFRWIDLAAVDIDDITNEFHFGTKFSSRACGNSGRLGELFDQMFFFPPERPERLALIDNCRQLELAWKKEEFCLYGEFIDELLRIAPVVVLAGFYDPEHTSAGIRRWTSPEFSFAVGPQSASFMMRGYAGAEKIGRLTIVRFRKGGAPDVLVEVAMRFSLWFEIEFDLPEIESGTTLGIVFDVPEHVADGDHRPLGVYLEQVRMRERVGGQLHSCDLGRSNDRFLALSRFEDWVERLKHVAVHRSSRADDLFAQVRGPHSTRLVNWLQEYGHNYDCILVQGIPFETIPASVAALSKLAHRPRIVTLPHFHGDDRFYYWRRYLNALSEADCNLIFSKSIADVLSPDAPVAVVAGGGVRVDELGSPASVSAFREVYGADKPFFLVLGRKTASKGYERIVAAHRRICDRSGTNLVLIGHDEDGKSIEADGCFYFGAQPREVIRGALSECVGLVSMSTSESFGIVLCEAWLFGKPVIANAACYSFRDLLKSSEGGILVDTDSDLEDAMLYLAGDLKARSSLGESGFRAVLEQYTWPRVAESIKNALVVDGCCSAESSAPVQG